MAGINTNYLSTNRGVIKILQIIAGFVVGGLLCFNEYSNRSSCFGDGRVGFATGMNAILLIINIVFFVLNFLNLSVWKLERVYAVIGTILFLVATILVVWFIVEYSANRTGLIIGAIALAVQFFLFLMDLKILQGEAPN